MAPAAGAVGAAVVDCWRRGGAAEAEGWRVWRAARDVGGGGQLLGWEGAKDDVVKVWDGGRRMVELVRAVAEDLVRVWLRGGGTLEVDEGRPEDVVGRELVGEGPENEIGRARGPFRVVTGGREAPALPALARDVVVLFWAPGRRKEPDRPRPKTPETGLLRVSDAPLSPLLFTAVEPARVSREVVDAVDEGPLRGSLLGDTLRVLLSLSRLESASFLWPRSPPAGCRTERDRDNDDDMAMRSAVVALLVFVSW